jgi:hypothetical protein
MYCLVVAVGRFDIIDPVAEVGTRPAVIKPEADMQQQAQEKDVSVMNAPATDNTEMPRQSPYEVISEQSQQLTRQVHDMADLQLQAEADVSQAVTHNTELTTMSAASSKVEMTDKQLGLLAKDKASEMIRDEMSIKQACEWVKQHTMSRQELMAATATSSALEDECHSEQQSLSILGDCMKAGMAQKSSMQTTQVPDEAAVCVGEKGVLEDTSTSTCYSGRQRNDSGNGHPHYHQPQVRTHGNHLSVSYIVDPLCWLLQIASVQQHNIQRNSGCCVVVAVANVVACSVIAFAACDVDVLYVINSAYNQVTPAIVSDFAICSSPPQLTC